MATKSTMTVTVDLFHDLPLEHHAALTEALHRVGGAALNVVAQATAGALVAALAASGVADKRVLHAEAKVNVASIEITDAEIAAARQSMDETVAAREAEAARADRRLN